MLCEEGPAQADLEHISDLTINNTQDLVESSDALKHK